MKFTHSITRRAKENKAPRSKLRGINFALQVAGFQPAFAPRSGELNPKRLKGARFKFLFGRGRIMRN
ncbi:MAG: hypothetical protein A2Z65_13230 [Gallionellales bacterium RIFCSPLOWO2_02_58_13]|nr:MAG: hypothetical protein A2Z65_13230 [Gallionellales bacterium RIFCSPLOWO2_02_58_13]